MAVTLERLTRRLDNLVERVRTSQHPIFKAGDKIAEKMIGKHSGPDPLLASGPMDRKLEIKPVNPQVLLMELRPGAEKEDFDFMLPPKEPLKLKDRKTLPPTPPKRGGKAAFVVKAFLAIAFGPPLSALVLTPILWPFGLNIPPLIPCAGGTLAVFFILHIATRGIGGRRALRRENERKNREAFLNQLEEMAKSDPYKIDPNKKDELDCLEIEITFFEKKNKRHLDGGTKDLLSEVRVVIAKFMDIEAFINKCKRISLLDPSAPPPEEIKSRDEMESLLLDVNSFLILNNPFEERNEAALGAQRVLNGFLETEEFIKSCEGISQRNPSQIHREETRGLQNMLDRINELLKWGTLATEKRNILLRAKMVIEDFLKIQEITQLCEAISEFDPKKIPPDKVGPYQQLLSLIDNFMENHNGQLDSSFIQGVLRVRMTIESYLKIQKARTDLLNSCVSISLMDPKTMDPQKIDVTKAKATIPEIDALLQEENLPEEIKQALPLARKVLEEFIERNETFPEITPEYLDQIIMGKVSTTTKQLIPLLDKIEKYAETIPKENQELKDKIDAATGMLTMNNTTVPPTAD